MAETLLVRPDLTPEMATAGRALLAGLGAHGIIFDAAFWLLDEESGEWHLVLSSRSVRKDGSFSLYHKVNRVLSRLQLQDAIWIGEISIVDDRAQIVQSLRGALGTTASVDGARLDNATIGGMRIPGCMLYRLSTRQQVGPQIGKPIEQVAG
jgi:hypothetical protein